MPRPSAFLLRVVTGQGAIPRPRWLERLLTALDKTPRRIDTSRISDSDLAATGLSRADLHHAIRQPDWDPPEYWLNRPEPPPCRGRC